MSDTKAIDIKVLLLKRKITQVQIARELGVSKVMVNRVVNGIGRSQKVEDYINRLMRQEIGRGE